MGGHRLKPKILIVAEAWGRDELALGEALVGASGSALLKMLSESGLITFTPEDKKCINNWFATQDPKWCDRVWKAHVHELARTNVFNLHPDSNDIERCCGGKTESIPGYPLLQKSKYIRAEFEPELNRLADEILSLNPNLVLCLGNTPLWALGGRTGIKKWRGTTLESTHTVAGFKLLPTYHPAAVLRGWELRPIVIADLMKARREQEFPDIRRPARDIWIEPGIDDVRRFIDAVISPRRGVPLSVDIETSGTRVTCIGFGYSDVAIVIPFDDSRQPDGNYWASGAVEGVVWGLIRDMLADARVPKLFQNGLYDIAFLKRSVNISVMGAFEDSMILHHALQPELEKGLGFLGSVYADEGAWKHMRTKVSKTIKRDA